MKLSKNSWHYKFNKLIHDAGWCFDLRNTKSLCPYFWGTMFNMFTSTVIALSVYVFFTVIGVGILENEGFEWNILMWLYAWIIPLLILVLLVFIIAGCIGLNNFYKERKYTKNEKLTSKPKTKPKEPNIFVEWFRAKKEKICPFIEWGD